MNNLLLVATLLVSSGFAFVAQQSALRNLRRESERLAREIASTRSLTIATVATIASLKDKLEEQRNRRTELHPNLAPEAQSEGAIPLEPEKEGLWPVGKPYFYLSKKYLADALFQRFQPSESGLGLHPNTALALGMTPAEAATIGDGFEDLVVAFVRRKWRDSARDSTIGPVTGA